MTHEFNIIDIIQVWSDESQGMKLNGFICAVEDIEIWKLQSHCGRYKKIRVRKCGAAWGCCEELSTPLASAQGDLPSLIFCRFVKSLNAERSDTLPRLDLKVISVKAFQRHFVVPKDVHRKCICICSCTR